MSATGDGLIALAALWQAPLRDAQIHGFALLMILGVSQRLFHHFYALPLPNQRLSLALLPVLNLAVAGEMAGLILMRVAGHAWAALWYGSVLVLTVSVVALVRNWHIYSSAEDSDRSLKFLRTAYAWLFISLAMLVFLPVYQGGLLPWLAAESDAVQIGFSHAYYGATRHAITVGFVSLMIVGVAAKVVPTLNGVNVHRLSSLWAPFVLINLGCTLRVVSQTLTDFVPHAFPFAGASGLLEVTGLTLWGSHLWLVMAGRPRLRPAQPSAASGSSQSAGGEIHPTSTVGTVLAERPELLDTLLAFGFAPLAQPVLRDTVARVVTIEQACRRMDVDLEKFLQALEKRRRVTERQRPQPTLVPLSPSPSR